MHFLCIQQNGFLTGATLLPPYQFGHSDIHVVFHAFFWMQNKRWQKFCADETSALPWPSLSKSTCDQVISIMLFYKGRWYLSECELGSLRLCCWTLWPSVTITFAQDLWRHGRELLKRCRNSDRSVVHCFTMCCKIKRCLGARGSIVCCSMEGTCLCSICFHN